MRLTEALHFYSCPKRPNRKWMELNYSHFCPSVEDDKLRKRLHKDDRKVRKKRKVMKELFD